MWNHKFTYFTIISLIFFGCNRKTKEPNLPTAMVPPVQQQTINQLKYHFKSILPFNVEFGVSPNSITGLTSIADYAKSGQHTIGQERIVNECSTGNWKALDWYFKTEGQSWASEDHKEYFFGFKNQHLVTVLVNYNSESRFNVDRQTMSHQLQTTLMDQHDDPYVSGAMWGSIGDNIAIKYLLQKPRGEDMLALIIFNSPNSDSYDAIYGSIQKSILEHGGTITLPKSEQGELQSRTFSGPFGLKPMMSLQELRAAVGEFKVEYNPGNDSYFIILHSVPNSSKLISDYRLYLSGPNGRVTGIGLTLVDQTDQSFENVVKILTEKYGTPTYNKIDKKIIKAQVGDWKTNDWLIRWNREDLGIKEIYLKKSMDYDTDRIIFIQFDYNFTGNYNESNTGSKPVSAF